MQHIRDLAYQSPPSLKIIISQITLKLHYYLKGCINQKSTLSVKINDSLRFSKQITFLLSSLKKGAFDMRSRATVFFLPTPSFHCQSFSFMMWSFWCFVFKRAKLGGNLTKLTLETFLEWKKRKASYGINN